jgi:hypothetical protein
VLPKRSVVRSFRPIVTLPTPKLELWSPMVLIRDSVATVARDYFSDEASSQKVKLIRVEKTMKRIKSRSRKPDSSVSVVTRLRNG